MSEKNAFILPSHFFKDLDLARYKNLRLKVISQNFEGFALLPSSK